MSSPRGSSAQGAGAGTGARGTLEPEVRDDAWELLEGAMLHYRGEPVGTVAAVGADPAWNYDECFVRDFAVSAAVFLAHDRHEPVRNFLHTTRELQSRGPRLDSFRPGPGLMPASFGVVGEGDDARLVADFGQRAIGRVAPVDAALWWLLILRAYVRASGDRPLVREPATIRTIERILDLYLPPRFEMLPTLLVPDGAFMIDRRMGVYGHPLELQALFFGALRAARELLPEDHPHQPSILERLGHLGHHLRAYYWIDEARLQEISRFQVNQFGMNVSNRFDLSPEAIPAWAREWLTENTGYFAGNLGPARIDCRFFSGGNLLTIGVGLATRRQCEEVCALLERRQDDLLEAVPMKLVFPALEGHAWQVTTGFDQKNVAWAYHNGGSWPSLLWSLTRAMRIAGREDLAAAALERAAARVRDDDWPEYYEGRASDRVGRRARLRQTWTAAALLAADALLAAPGADDPFAFEADEEVEHRLERVARASDAWTT